MAKNRNSREDEERIEGTFPIRETNEDMKMKNISPSALPHFHGLTTEDPDTFLFEFVVLFRTYDYTEDEQKLKLFPSTLKDATLRWFMGFLETVSPLGLRCKKLSIPNTGTTIGPRKPREKYFG